MGSESARPSIFRSSGGIGRHDFHLRPPRTGVRRPPGWDHDAVGRSARAAQCPDRSPALLRRRGWPPGMETERAARAGRGRVPDRAPRARCHRGGWLSARGRRGAVDPSPRLLSSVDRRWDLPLLDCGAPDDTARRGRCGRSLPLLAVRRVHQPPVHAGRHDDRAAPCRRPHGHQILGAAVRRKACRCRAARNLVEKQCSWESYGDRVLACTRTGSAEPALARRALRPREGEGSGRSRPGRSWPALSSAGTAEQWVGMDPPRSSVGGDDG
jgi:hypothetical protein